MHHQIASDRFGAVVTFHGDHDFVALFLDLRHLRFGAQIDAQLCGRLDQHRDQIGIKVAQGAVHHLQHGHLARARALGHMGEFHRDEPAADKGDAVGTLGQFQEIGRGGEILLARDVQRHRSGTGGDVEMLRPQGLAVQLDRIGAGKPYLSVQDVDPGLFQPGLDARWHRVGEAALEGDHVGPVDRRLRLQPLALHVFRPLDALGDGDQHLLGIATAQGAGAAMGLAVDAGDAPAGIRRHPGDAIATGSTADHDKVVALRHKVFLFNALSEALFGWMSAQFPSGRRAARVLAPERVNGQQDKDAQCRKQHEVEISDDGGQADRAEEDHQNGRKAAERHNDGADDAHFQKAVRRCVV